ncbi:MAG: hypothetical protein J4400_01165 [Candidatus Aenigmarchaeota archaeon]|nr:hypothetical protein [Candidatus Aenigmarchaeota archaeon]
MEYSKDRMHTLGSSSSPYWHDIQTEKSWKLLQGMKGKFPFVLIGGWAVYLWTRSQKSKDIDIIVDIKTLSLLKKTYDLRKNDMMRKYEIKIDEIDIDIYVNHYSQLPLLEKMEATKIEGFDVAKPEFLLALKQTAELARRESEKGEKDRIDIFGMLLKCDINFRKYAKLLGKDSDEFLKRLASIVKAFKEPDYFGMNPRQLKLAKQKILKKIKGA